MINNAAQIGLHRSYVKIDTAALAHNIRVLKEDLAENAIFSAVIKSNAYGHGANITWKAFQEGGADCFCVDSLHEAYDLRADGYDGRLFVMGHIPPMHAREAIELNVLSMVYDAGQVDAFGAASSKARRVAELMIKLETGTQRQGLKREEALVLAKHIARYPYLKLRGLASHFANIEDTTDHSFAFEQLRVFNEAVEHFKAAGFTGLWRSIANSAASILFPETHMELVRAGITCYGMWPSTESYVSAKLLHKVVDLKPALNWETIVAQVKEIEPGSDVGYGCTFRCTHKTKLAIIPVGYYDGYPRALSNLGYALIRGQRAPIRGRICMNMCMLDVSDIENVQSGEEVVLLGKQDNTSISAETLAGWAHTINYEITTQIQSTVPRIAV